MVTRDRAENRDGPKVRGGRRGSRDPWSSLGTVSLRPWVWEEAGDAGLEGGGVHGRSKEPGAGEKAAKKKGTGSEQDLRGRQKQKRRSGVRLVGVGSLTPRGRGRGLVFE